MIENEAKGSFFGSVFGKKDDGFIEVAIAKRGVSEDDLFLEIGWDGVGVHGGILEGEMEWVKVLLRISARLGKLVRCMMDYGLIEWPDLGRFTPHEYRSTF